MQGVADSLTGLALVALAALACGLVMRRIHQPAVVGYILAGAILGPSALGVVENREVIRIMAELGVLMLLFLIGMELSLRGIRDVWKVALLTAVLQIAVGLAAMALLGYLLDWSLPFTVLLGFVVALSSTAVAIKMLEEIGELRSRVGQITVGILVAQDLAVVPMMLVLGSFRGEGGFGVEALLKIALALGVLALLIFYLQRRARVRLPFAQMVGNNHDLTPLAGLAFCFGAAALSGLLGLSAAYGAFLAGLVIGNSTARRAMVHNTAPIQGVLLMVFFLSIGLLIDFNYIWDNLGTVVLLVAFVALFKTAINILFIRLLGQPWPHAFLSGVLLAQLGEFSFVLVALGFNAGLITGEDHRLIVAVTVLSLVASPLWLEFARRLNRVALLGVTSARETLRITFGRDLIALAQEKLGDARIGFGEGSDKLRELLRRKTARSAGED